MSDDCFDNTAKPGLVYMEKVMEKLKENFDFLISSNCLNCLGRFLDG